MISDLFWSVYTPFEQTIQSTLVAYTQHLTKHGEIDSGSATDASRDGLPIAVRDNVAIIPITGTMVRRAGPLGRVFGLAGTDSIRLAVNSAINDPDIEHILFRVDSPGGSISGLRELGDVIKASPKPTTVQVEGLAASAAYYVASQADNIFVGPTDLVGSIGVRVLMYDFSKAFMEDGIEPVVIDTGEFKSAGALGTKITETQRTDFQRVVDFYFEDFIRAVSTGRGLVEGQVREAADGRVFTPQEAISMNLIDGVSTYQNTLNNLRNRKRKESSEVMRARLRLG